MIKTCTNCGDTKPLSEYHHRRDARRPNMGRYPISRCKDCERERLRENTARLRAEASNTYGRDCVQLGYAKAARRACRRMARRRSAHLREALDAARLFVPEPTACDRCARVYVPTTSRQRYCSAACNWREQRSRRRARMRDAYVEEVTMADIYQRDGGVCQLCYEPVDRRCTYPNPRNPVLDHIVPLARGGKHEGRNVQLAHAECNNRKKDGSAGSQLRMFG